MNKHRFDSTTICDSSGGHRDQFPAEAEEKGDHDRETWDGLVGRSTLSDTVFGHPVDGAQYGVRRGFLR